MASISIPLPWQHFVAPRLPDLQTGLNAELPGFTGRLFIDGETFAALVSAEGGGAAAYAVASYLAPLWPAMLEEHGVELHVEVDGLAWTADGALMGALARGKCGRLAWLAGSGFSDS